MYGRYLERHWKSKPGGEKRKQEKNNELIFEKKKSRSVKSVVREEKRWSELEKASRICKVRSRGAQIEEKIGREIKKEEIIFLKKSEKRKRRETLQRKNDIVLEGKGPNRWKKRSFTIVKITIRVKNSTRKRRVQIRCTGIFPKEKIIAKRERGIV